MVDAFKTKPKDEFAHFIVYYKGVEGPFIAELPSLQDTPIRVVHSSNNVIRFGDLKLTNMDSELYLIVTVMVSGIQVFINSIQPEMVYYSPKIFELMKN